MIWHNENHVRFAKGCKVNFMSIEVSGYDLMWLEVAGGGWRWLEVAVRLYKGQVLPSLP